MATFVPKEIEPFAREVLDIVDACHAELVAFVPSEDDADEIIEVVVSDFDDFECEVTESLDVAVCVGNTGCEMRVTIGCLIDVVRCHKSKTLVFDRTWCHLPRVSHVMIEPMDLKTAHIASYLTRSGKSTMVKFGDMTANIALVEGSVEYAMASSLGNYSFDEEQSGLSNEIFIRVEHDGISNEGVVEVARAYMFELSTTFALRFSVWSLSHFDDDEDAPKDHDYERDLWRMRPLLIGKGLTDLIGLFNQGVSSTDEESAVLCFVKCIEFVSATVVRQQQHDELRKRLHSPSALAPEAEFLDELVALVEENRILTRDAEAIRATIERCCDPIPMRSVAPPFLKGVVKLSQRSKSEERTAALAEFSSCLYATRNRFSHAKSNYKPSGRECPAAQMAALAHCAKIAAEQCVRWYAAQSPAART